MCLGVGVYGSVAVQRWLLCHDGRFDLHPIQHTNNGYLTARRDPKGSPLAVCFLPLLCPSFLLDQLRALYRTYALYGTLSAPGIVAPGGRQTAANPQSTTDSLYAYHCLYEDAVEAK